jgi:hypothetical protein
MLVLLVALAACDDSVFPLRARGSGVVYEPTWAGTTAFVADNCESCHSAEAGTTPTLPDAIADDVAAGTGQLVVAHDSTHSLLWQMLNPDTVPAGKPGVMPFGSAGLPTATIAPIQEWIDAGASLDDETGH